MFDRAAAMRKQAGELGYPLLRYDNDANCVVHFSEWSSLDKARRFFESPELAEVRRTAGVKAPGSIHKAGAGKPARHFFKTHFSYKSFNLPAGS